MPPMAFNILVPSPHSSRDNGALESNPLKESLKIISVDKDDTVASDTASGGSPLNSFPLIRLDVDLITDSIAGRLATSLLGQVLFLKNQIPLPVMRLEKIPRGQNTNTRVDKQITEFLATFDTISSHMDTTFSALSTALSRCYNNKDSTITRVYLAILVGPSLGSAKSKVVLGIDGLEKRIWGNRGNVSRIPDVETNENEEDDAAAETEDDAEGPDDSDESEELEEDSEDDCENDSRLSSSPPSVKCSHANEQIFLQNAERLLARTLAAADEDGRGISSEMSPTQTHILIRAPRRFNHPAWIPRQNLSVSLDGMLHDFLDLSGIGFSTPPSQPKHLKKNHIEGVWITCRAGIQKEITDDVVAHDILLAPDEDDMIWWSWEGKLAGFF